jgi:hypothetical protein
MRVLLVFFALFLPITPTQQNSKSPPKTATQESSMTGYLDQEGSVYILREGSEMKKIADLEPGSFKNDYFANYVGTQVKVYGRISTAGGVPIVHVTRIEKLGS